MTLVGKKAPDFVLEGVQNNEITDFQFEGEGLRGTWRILFFYPRSFTGVCESEIKGFAKEYERFKKLGFELFAISTDSSFVHRAWLQKDIPDVKFPLLADTRHDISVAYGVLADNGAALRATFIIDPKGIVVHESVNFFPVGRSTEEIYRLACAFKSGGSCSLDWKPPS